jgi:hypothetical protein
MQITVMHHSKIESEPLPGSSAVICMADSPEQLAVIKDYANVVARLNLIFNDTTQEFGVVRPPKAEDAQRILQFVQTHIHLPHLVVQCQVGVGRSMAVMAALQRIYGLDNSLLLGHGTYNRKLYFALLSAAGLPPDPQPLVSMAVRVKYAPDRLRLFILSMQRQRHENWELIAVTDGPNPAAARLLEEVQDSRIRLIETEKPLGHWGHPYRQRGIDACRGEFIGMSNDDNYYVPGYLEQMLHALKNADLALCHMIHSYMGWALYDTSDTDLGSWLSRASLVRQVPWSGQNHESDRVYVQSLRAIAGGRVVTVPRPLFVHN